jgi:transposase InsO family protein
MLLSKIQEVYRQSRKNYGSPRIHQVLKSQGMPLGRKRVARVMREHGIVAEPFRRQRWKRCFKTAKAADNLVKQQFTVSAPNRIWAADMSAFWTSAGWIHLAIVMDLYSRRIVGWAMHGFMTERLVINALEMAIMNRRPTEPLIHHSDQGSQYQSQTFRAKLKEHGMTLSMSRRGNCWDNAPVESFFKTVKAEMQNDACFKSREEARAQLFEYIEVFYNRQRLHSTLGYQSPAQFENQTLPIPVSTKAG